MPSPPVDGRSRADVERQTATLATRFSGWRPRPDGQPDAGSALIAIAARFAEQVIDRLNRAPERSYLAFLNLIRVQPLPPQSARAPLTFTLVPGTTGGVVVPKGTQVAASSDSGQASSDSGQASSDSGQEGSGSGQEDAAEVVFETEDELVITPAQLIGVLTSDTETDTWADRSPSGDGAQSTDALTGFSGDQPVPHELFVAVDESTVAADANALSVIITGARPGVWSTAVAWDRWDADAAAWSPVTVASTEVTPAPPGGQNCAVRLTGVPALKPSVVNGITARWLRARITAPLPPGDSGLQPDSVAVGGRPPTDWTPELSLFGEDAGGKWCYLSADQAIAPGGAVVSFTVSLSRPAAARASNPVQLVWSYKDGNDWRELGRSSTKNVREGASTLAWGDGTLGFTRDGTISFPCPLEWPQDLFRGRGGRWLRIEIADEGGQYTTRPRLSSMTVGYTWELPAVTAIAVRSDLAAQQLRPATAYAGSDSIDLSADFQPFGSTPGFGSTWYVTCPDRIARSAAPYVLSVQLTNPAGARNAPVPLVQATPQIRWETFDGAAWQPATVDRSDVFTTGGDIRITPARPLAQSTVTGQDALWVRARIMGGDYGRPAGYVKNTAGGYDLIPSTLAPPMVTQVLWRGPTVASQPVDACVTHNDFVQTTQWSSAAGAGDPRAAFAPFTPGADRDPAVYLRFGEPFGPSPVSVYLQIDPPSPEDVAADRIAELDPATLARIVWEYSGPQGWTPLGAVDGTGSLSASGVVRFAGPPGQVARRCFGLPGHWLRVRWESGYFPAMPRISAVLPNTVMASHRTTIVAEILGSGNGLPGQVFTRAQTPCLPGEQVTVQDLDDNWTTWTGVPDLNTSGPGDAHYVADLATGQIRFGDGRRGQILPNGVNNIQVTYTTGGGQDGDRPSGAISQLKSGVPFVAGVTNQLPARGGSAGETTGRIGARGPAQLRHRDRAVTADDLEDLARAASPDVARVKAIPAGPFDPFDLWLDPENPVPSAAHRDADAGRCGIVVVPVSDAGQPTPSVALLRRVQEHVSDRCPATAGVWVCGPEWIEVVVTASIVPVSADRAEPVRAGVRAALRAYLHPLTGGPDGTGWAFGREPHMSDVLALAESVPGVDHVLSARIQLGPQSASLGPRLSGALNRTLAQAGREPLTADLQRWLDRALVHSGDHRISIVLRGQL